MSLSFFGTIPSFTLDSEPSIIDNAYETFIQMCHRIANEGVRCLMTLMLIMEVCFGDCNKKKNASVWWLAFLTTLTKLNL